MIGEKYNELTQFGFEADGNIGIIYLNSKDNLNAMTEKLKDEFLYKLQVFCDIRRNRLLGFPPPQSWKLYWF